MGSWVRLPSWALASPTELDVALRARLDAPATVGSHARHARLNLSRLGLDRLPTGAEPALRACDGVARLGAVRELDASGNALGHADAPSLELASETSLGAALTALNLSGNELTAGALHRARLPPRLRSLDLSTNTIAALPPNVLTLRSLIRLELARNRLARLPALLGTMLPALELLDLSHNAFVGFTPAQLGAGPAPDGGGARPAFPNLAVLRLRANRIDAFELGALALPRLTKLDLACNRLARPSESLCSLRTLAHLNLSSNALVSLFAADTAPTCRLWVPAGGIHQLHELRVLSLAQNRLTSVPPTFGDALAQNGSLAELDVRCNPLTSESQAVLARLAAGTRAGAEHVRVRCSAVHRMLPGLLLADSSVSWDLRTLRSIGVTHIVRVAEPSELGASRHARPICADDPSIAGPLRLLGLSRAAGDDGGGGEGGGRGALLDARVVRDAFLRIARTTHPDRLPSSTPAAEQRAAEAAFAAARAAYEAVCEAARAEAVQLPTFSELRYHTLHLRAADPAACASAPAADAPAASHTSAVTPPSLHASHTSAVTPPSLHASHTSAVTPPSLHEARAAASDAACRALDDANRFIHEARSAPAGAHVVLVHAASGWARAAAVVAAYTVASSAEPLDRAFDACAAGVLPALRGHADGTESSRGDAAGLDVLPVYLREALRAFEAECKAQRRRVAVVTEPGADVSAGRRNATANARGDEARGPAGGSGERPTAADFGWPAHGALGGGGGTSFSLN